MKIFEAYKNKIPIATINDGSWHTVTITGIPNDTCLVSVETYTPTGFDIGVPATGNTGARPTGTSQADGVWIRSTRDGQYDTQILPVNAAKEMDFYAVRNDAQFSVVAAWGGDAVKSFGPDLSIATGWTTGNSESWRTLDLTSLLPTEDQGNVEAVVCFFRPGAGSQANARPYGSTWDIPGSPPGPTSKGDNVVKVDGDNLIEVYEGDDGSKDMIQNSWVYFVGYILRGAYVNFDDGKFYRYHGIVSPQDDNIYTNGDVWDTFPISTRTASPTVVGAYWRETQYAGSGPQTTYVREIGSSNLALSGTQNVRGITGYPLNTDVNGEVEYNLEDANTESWLFGYLEEVTRRKHVSVTEL